MNRALALVCLAALIVSVGAQAQSARISHWVDNAEQSDKNSIALGYPVPIPVDTPLPFDGFRTYAGLHARHQDLAQTTPWVHPVAVGSTHAGRTVWAYRLGDVDLITRQGLAEPAMLSNGGIHAREWQSPETVTGIMELLVDQQGDQHLYSYLRDNVNVIVLPVLNVDGLIQTQRYPDSNWMGTDPSDPEGSPRDGRMRRKNMLNVDESLATQDDHLNGVDLNRNNLPYWHKGTGSSGETESILYRGTAPASEPEILALDAAAQLGPIEKLSMYTDLHSYSKQHLWAKSGNARLAWQMDSLLRTFSRHHDAFPAGKYYAFTVASGQTGNQGIGTTDEYFTYTYQVPAWTFEIEPGNAAGVEYGGLGRNGHDGFILPASQIRRVRTELAQTFAVAYYRQAGPPSITTFHLVDKTTGATVYEAGWDAVSDGERALYQFQPQAVQLGRQYTAWIAFDKPMRWQNNGEIVVLPGQAAASLDVDARLSINDVALNSSAVGPRWLSMPGGAPNGYQHYFTDTLAVDFSLPADAENQSAVNGMASAAIELSLGDMTSLLIDADPSTVAHWESGAWSGYENEDGVDNTDTGGTDSTLHFDITSENPGEPFVIEAGTSSAWFDPQRGGEGFMLEILAENKAVMYWFTYDDEGQQDWYIAVGEIRGNRIVFPQLLQISGGEFGPGFDPSQVSETVVGSASFIWSDCDSGAMEWELDTGGNYQHGRMQLTRLSRVMGIDCGKVMLPPVRVEAQLSGSWFDPTHAGEGYTLELLTDSRALVYWFSFDASGKRRWFFGVGKLAGGHFVFDDMLTTHGPVFGDLYDPADVTELPWGSLELDLQCGGGKASFSSTEPGFPAGELNLVQLTSLKGLNCP